MTLAQFNRKRDDATNAIEALRALVAGLPSSEANVSAHIVSSPAHLMALLSVTEEAAHRARVALGRVPRARAFPKLCRQYVKEIRAGVRPRL